MTTDALFLLGQAGTLLIGSLGVGVALLNQRRQLNAQMFLEFSKRFQDLLRLFPSEAWFANRNPAYPLPPPSQEVTDCALYCIYCIADVYHLRKRGYIPKSLWVLWKRDIDRALKGRIFEREWPNVREEFSHDNEFLGFIHTLTEGKLPSR